MRRRVTAALCLLLTIFPASAQPDILRAFRSVDDTLTTMARERFTVKSDISLWKAMKRGSELDLYYSRNLSDYPWKEGDIEWMRNQLKKFWPSSLREYKLGDIYCRSENIRDLVTPTLGKNGRPQSWSRAFTKHRTADAFVRREGARRFTKGLNNRTIALWQSHGLYYDGGAGVWGWQRAPIWRTVEDLYTQSYVIPFLIPMLERAGAYVMTPRERDTQMNEVICDNDQHYTQDSPFWEYSPWVWNMDSPLPERSHGKYTENGSWSNAGTGFRDVKEIYTFGDNPFKAGTARQTSKGSARWTPDIPERGEYAVYVSYKSISGSTTAACYTVHHMGGNTSFTVNQRIGGGTWIYLGTFLFDKGKEGYVTVENKGSGTLTADAVRFGGGVGKTARGGYVSGMPSYLEGALYWMQWAGADASLYDKWDGDYTKDYAGRGAWVKWMKNSLGVPFDLSLAFHSDAGTTPNDSTVGTLAIYTLLEDNSDKFSNGESRYAGRALCDYVQTQVVSDIRADFDPEWNRRQIWNRSYSECRTTDVPGMILELLSHQNFSDMKYGLDPAFRFEVSRAVYKGMLKFLSTWYGVSYEVAPLPVKDFSVAFGDGGSAHLSWTPVEDEKEPTAKPSGYLVYTRKDDGGFDNGREFKGTSADIAIEPGHVYSFMVEAFNEGGRSFPSEVLSIGLSATDAKKVLIVSNFDRIAGPSFFDTERYAGFDDGLDSGVPYKEEINFLGENYEYRREQPWVSNYSPGFGGSQTDRAGNKYAGNTFDYAAVHGKALLALGYSFFSQNAGAYAAAPDTSVFAVDLICGKQMSTVTGRNPKVRSRVYPEALRNALRLSAAAGSNLIVSGSHVSSDAWDGVYPFGRQSDWSVNDAARAEQALYQTSAKYFIQNTLGIKWTTTRGTRDGVIRKGRQVYEIWNRKNPHVYCVETCDGIAAAGKNGRSVLKYRSTNSGAAVFCKFDSYRTAVFGFPLETLKKQEDIKDMLQMSLESFSD